MTEHTFTLVFTMADDSLEPHLDALVDAGCDDATFAGPAPNGTFEADFDREAPTFPEAVVSAVRAVRDTLPGFHLRRLAPDDLVSQSAIAERTGRSVESVRLFIAGKRGPGGFPLAAAAINHKTQIWSWVEVSHWWTDVLGEELADVDAGRFIAYLNLALRGAALRRDVAHAPDAKVIATITSQELAAR
jgi:hypothetical protein